MNGFSPGHWLVVAAIVWIVYRLIRSRARPEAPQPSHEQKEPGTLDVVGESFYKANLQRLFPIRHEDDDDEEVEALAILRCENDNPHDDQAVGIYIRGLKVGHLARTTARAYRKARNGDLADVQANAIVSVPDNPDYDYSVTLHAR